MHLAVKRGNIFVNILLPEMFFHVYPAVYLLNKIYVS